MVSILYCQVDLIFQTLLVTTTACVATIGTLEFTNSYLVRFLCCHPFNVRDAAEVTLEQFVQGY